MGMHHGFVGFVIFVIFRMCGRILLLCMGFGLVRKIWGIRGLRLFVRSLCRFGWGPMIRYVVGISVIRI